MKTLKFMLAAATAIGLASASQADQKIVPTPLNGGTITFDSATTGTAATNLTGFAFNGDPADDASEVVAPGRGDTGKALQVSVGTEPILRALDWGDSIADPVHLSSQSSVTIDTYVQFTVTPSTESVEPSADDKLMIFLKDDGATTNLYAVAGYYDDVERVLTNGVFKIASEVPAGVWKHLVVKAYSDISDEKYGCPGFVVELDGAVCHPDTYYVDESGEVNADGFNGDALLSMKAAATPGDGVADPTLQYVGFAGEGLVDDITVTKYQTVNSVDFTLTLGQNVVSVAFNLGNVSTNFTESAEFAVFPNDTITSVVATYANGYRAETGYPAAGGSLETLQDGYKVGNGACSLTFSAVLNSVSFTFTKGTGVDTFAWTIGEGEPSSALSGSAAPGTVLTLAVTYSDWYEAPASGLKNGDTVTLQSSGNDFAINASQIKVTPPAEDGTISVNPNMSASEAKTELGITTSAFDGDGTSAALNKALGWATKNTAGNMSKADAVAAINSMVFTEGNENQPAKAYLLNCANTPEAVAAAVAGFKFESFDPANPPADTYFDAKGYNGDVTIQGATTLGTWHDATTGDKFFRAVLTK